MLIGVQAAADGHHPHYLSEGPVEVVRVGEQLVRMMRAREATEEKLGVQEDYYRSLIENTADLITVVDADGLVQYSSPAVQRVLGVASEEREGRSSVELIHPEDRHAFAERISASAELDPGDTLRWEGRLRHASGSYRVIEAVGSAYVSAQGVRHTIVHARDVTDRAEIEQRLRARRAAASGREASSRDAAEYDQSHPELDGCPARRGVNGRMCCQGRPHQG